jgi:WD40 repeat protein
VVLIKGKLFFICAGSDFKLLFWNVGTEEPVLEIEVPEQVWSMSFNYNGNKLACTAKDKKLRIIDSHSGEILKVRVQGFDNTSLYFL